MKYALEVSTPTDFAIVMKRTFNAPRHLVWKAMTQPEYIRQWIFAPDGWAMTICEADDNVGGTFRWVWAGPDGQRSLTIWGVNREIVPFEKMVHTENMEVGGVTLGELLASIELTEADGETHLQMTLLFPSKEARDAALASGIEKGVSIGYGRLDAIFVSMV
jgi:uncharacterized protein YndB with AHSA1/START domain